MQTIEDKGLKQIYRKNLTVSRITDVNETFLTTTGRKREDVIGNHCYKISHNHNEPCDFHDVTCLLPDVFATGQSQSFRHLHQGRDGKGFWSDIVLSPLLDKQGNIIQVIESIRDVTEQKKLEAQLYQAQKMEAVGTLAGGIAHDFNNLLTGILGNISLMLLDTEASHPFYEDFKVIEKLVQSGAELTRQLLGFARGGKYVVSAVDLNELVEKASVMFGRAKKEIVIHRKSQKDIWAIEADRGQIEQVFLNLFVNAWHAMPGGGELFLETENVKLDKNYLRPFKVKSSKYVKISVADTGVGMDKATQKRIFEPFFTTKERGMGTGLGLASVYGIIKNHDGFINVYSEVGKGSTFTIYLPASSGKAEKDTPLECQDLLRGSETILLVDDEEAIVNVGERILRSLGYKVLTAMSGQEAIEKFKEKYSETDLVVLDKIMPGLNCEAIYNALKEIKAGVFENILRALAEDLQKRNTPLLMKSVCLTFPETLTLKNLLKKDGKKS